MREIGKRKREKEDDFGLRGSLKRQGCLFFKGMDTKGERGPM